MADELRIKVLLDTGEVKEGFLSVEKDAKKSAKNIEGSFDNQLDGLTSKIKGLGIALAAAFSVGKLVNFLRDSTTAAAEAERATNSLAASLAQIGKFSNEAVDSFSKFATQLQAQTGIEDDLIKQNAALLVSIGGLSGEGLERATQASLNLSQALQIDVGTAFDLVSKAASGNTSQLGRYGIKLDENIPKNEKFAATLQLIEQRFGGLAETRLNTFEGALANLSNAFGEVKEAIGGIITSSPSLRAAINFIAESFFSLSESISEAAKGKDLLKDILDTLVQIGAVINAFVIAPIETLINLVITGAKTMALAFQGIVVVLNYVANAIVLSTVIPIQKVISALGSLASFVSEDFGNKIKNAGNSFRSFFEEPLNESLTKSKENFELIFDSLSESAETAFNTNMADSVSTWLADLKGKLDQAKTAQDQFKNNTSANALAIEDIYKNLRDQINKAVGQGIVTTISGSIQRIGASLVKGQSAFDDFGAFILGVLGDLSIQVGSMLIAMGLGVDSLKVALATFNGAAAVAAGAALIALGGALKAMSGGIGSSSAAASTGGGIAATPSTSTDLTPTQDLQRTEASTGVSVVIQGDVLDSDESGSRIVNLINQAFDKKGVVINQGVMA